MGELAGRKKERAQKILWFVNFGPDESHMFECSVFDTRRDAREFCARLIMNDRDAGRSERPYEVLRAEYNKSNIWGDSVNFTTVDRNHCQGTQQEKQP